MDFAHDRPESLFDLNRTGAYLFGAEFFTIRLQTDLDTCRNRIEASWF